MRFILDQFASLPSAIRRRFFAWILFCAALFVSFGVYTFSHLKYESDLLALLPQVRHDRDTGEAVDRFTQAMARRMIFLIADRDGVKAKAAADAFGSSLQNSPHFRNVQWKFGGDLAEQVQLYRAHAGGLLSAGDAERLRDGQGEKLYRQALQQALTPVGLMRPLGLSDDPLGLLSDFILAQAPSVGRAQIDGEYLIAHRSDVAYVLVIAECAGSPFAGDYQVAARAAIDSAKRLIDSSGDTSVLESGALMHAESASARAQKEVSFFGGLSLAIMLGLVILVLRGISPIALSALVLSVSLTAALSATQWMFGEVHLLALVFGSSLVGVVVDYSLHFLVDRYRQPASWSGVEALAHVGPSLLWGCLATVAGYIALMWVPLPGLRQIALFCFVGSLAGCLSVLCLYPAWFTAQNRSGVPSRRLLNFATRIDGRLKSIQSSPMTWVIASAVAVIVAFGIARIEAKDDLRALQSSTPELLSRERAVQEALGASIETGIFLVRGESVESALRAEERLVEKLDELVERQALTGYVAMSRAIPSRATQEANRRIIESAVLAQGGPFEKILTTFGYPRGDIETRRKNQSQAPMLEFTDWMESPASKPYRQFWLGQLASGYAGVVTVSGIHDLRAVSAAAEGVAGVAWIDRVADISTLLRDYRTAASWMWGAIVAIILAVLSFRFGFGLALRAALPCIAATFVTMSLFGWLGLPINLFVVLAMLLVLALGIDYGLVLMNQREGRGAGIISVSLSAATTAFSFVLLSFSSMGFIANIGLGLGIGITFTWLFAIVGCRGVEIQAR